MGDSIFTILSFICFVEVCFGVMVCRQVCEDKGNMDIDDIFQSQAFPNRKPNVIWGKPKIGMTRDPVTFFEPKKEKPKMTFGGKSNAPKQEVPTQETCHILSTGIDEKIKEKIVEAHNRLRLKVAKGNEPYQPSASNMNELHWDEELAEWAQKLTDRCEMKHDSVVLKQYGELGQNLARRIASFPESVPNLRPFINKWYDEVKIFKGKKLHPFIPGTYGHYTQLAWANTKAVGCALTTFKDALGRFDKLFACNYGPAGNMEYGTMYKSGTPCSACKHGCSKKNPGLCIAD